MFFDMKIVHQYYEIWFWFSTGQGSWDDEKRTKLVVFTPFKELTMCSTSVVLTSCLGWWVDNRGSLLHICWLIIQSDFFRKLDLQKCSRVSTLLELPPIKITPSIVKFIKGLTLTRVGHLIPVIGDVNIS